MHLLTACSFAVPMSTGISAGPVAVREVSIGVIARNQPASPTKPHGVMPPTVQTRYTHAPSTSVTNAATISPA